MVKKSDYEILYYLYPTSNIYVDEKYNEDGTLASHGAIQFVADFAYPVFANGLDDEGNELITLRDESDLNELDALESKEQQPLAHTTFYREGFEAYVDSRDDIILIPYEELQRLVFDNRSTTSEEL